MGAVKAHRAWCPYCFLDSIETGNEPYDKLIWLVQTSKRCILHRCELVIRCSACALTQGVFHSELGADYCNRCSASLIEPIRIPKSSYEAFIGERDTSELLEYCAREPETEFPEGAAKSFILEAHRIVRDLVPSSPRYSDLQLRYVLRNVRGVRAKRPPGLPSLAYLAEVCGVSILRILCDPKGACKAISFQEDIGLRASVRKPRQAPAKAIALEAAILAEQKRCGLDKPRSIREICKDIGVSSSYATKRFPELVKTHLILRHERSLARNRENRRRAKELVEGKGLPLLETGNLQQQRHVVQLLSKAYSVPTPPLREAMQAAMNARLLEKGTIDSTIDHDESDRAMRNN